MGKYLLLCLVGLLVTHTQLHSQFLFWDYYNILDESRESGSRPDMVVDGMGMKHIVYWHSTEDRAIYMQEQSDGTYLREYIQSSTSNGYVVNIALDANDLPHVVFMENNNGLAEYRYGYRVGPDSWVVESIPNDPVKGWGGYGPNSPTVSSDRVQHTADILIEADGTPQIVFFDGWVSPTAFPLCNAASNYEFEMIQATKKAGLWVVRSFGEIADNNNSCGDPNATTFPLPNGDRYGEFPQIIQKSDGSLEVFCHSRYNNHILRYQSTLNDTTWALSQTDSMTNQIDFANWFWATVFFTFQGISAEVDANDDVHMVYGSSFEYGDNFFGLQNTNILTYAKVVGDDSVYYHPFGTDGSYTYRPYSDIAIWGTDTIGIVYSDLTTFELQSWISYDGGFSFTQSKILDYLGSARSPIVCDGDSFYIAYYDSRVDGLFMASQHLPDTGGVPMDWQIRSITQSQNHGESFDGVFVPFGGDTVSHLAFNDGFSGALYYANGSQSGSWSFSIDTLEAPGSGARAISNAVSTGETPVVAYVSGDEGAARLATLDQGAWSFETVGDSANATFTDVAISALDTIHLAYYDANRQCLRYQHRHINDPVWIRDSVDCDTLPIGEHPSIALNGETPHIAYFDASGLQLKYAFRDPISRMWVTDTVITSLSSPVGKFNSLKLTSTGLPKIATLDEQRTHVVLAEQDASGVWTVSDVDTAEVTNLGRPMDLVIDQFDNVWIAYNYNQNIDRVKLLHRDSQWREVAVGSTGQIANEFHFEIIGGDLYLAGKKNEPQNTGLAMLASPGGVFVEQTEPQPSAPEVIVKAFPNPFSESTTFRFELSQPQQINMSIFDLHGRELVRVLEQQKLSSGVTEVNFEGNGLSPGIYLAVVENGQSKFIQKLIVSN